MSPLRTSSRRARSPLPRGAHSRFLWSPRPTSRSPQQSTMATEENKEFDEELVDYEEEEETTTNDAKSAEAKDTKK